MTKISTAYRHRNAGDPAVGTTSEIIRESGLSDVALAHLADVSPPTVARLRHQASLWPRNSTITAILAACGVARGTMLRGRFHEDPLHAKLRSLRRRARRA